MLVFAHLMLINSSFHGGECGGTVPHLIRRLRQVWQPVLRPGTLTIVVADGPFKHVVQYAHVGNLLRISDHTLATHIVPCGWWDFRTEELRAPGYRSAYMTPRLNMCIVGRSSASRIALRTAKQTGGKQSYNL